MILGGGVVGLNSAIIALGMQADVWVLDKSVERMRDLEIALDGRVTLAMSNRLQIEEVLADADMVIGAVLVPGALAPKLVTREMLGLMRPGAVLVDVAIDQGGCFETSHATTHDDPVFEVDGIVHYCVANMPGAVPVTSTKALTNVTLPYVEAIADKGVAQAIADDPALAKGVNVVGGKVTYEAVARGARPRRTRRWPTRSSVPHASADRLPADAGWPSRDGDAWPASPVRALRQEVAPTRCRGRC